MVRHPLDVALSCFVQPFEGRGTPWAWSLEGVPHPSRHHPAAATACSALLPSLPTGCMAVLASAPAGRILLLSLLGSGLQHANHGAQG